MDVDLRKLRYFVAVAEELHFGRAAEHLHIAQPVLSRQIRALEKELGTQLFARDTRGTALSGAGEQLLADAVPLLAGADALRRRVARAAAGHRGMTVGFMPGLTVTAATRALVARHPGLTVDVLRTDRRNQVEVVRDGRVDVSCVRLPVDRTGLVVRPLFAEPRVAVLPADHALAGKESVPLTDLGKERLLQNPDAVPEWAAVAEERPAPPPIHSVEEKLEHVAAGHGIVVLPESTARYYTRADVSVVPIEDIAPSEVAVVWDATRRDPLFEEFAALAAQY